MTYTKHSTRIPTPAHSKRPARNFYQLILTLFAFLFASPAFAYSQHSELEELILGVVGSTLVSIVVVIVVFIRLKRTFLPRLLLSLATSLLVFPLCLAGSMATSYVAQQVYKKQSEETAQQLEAERQQEWQNNALRLATCDGNDQQGVEAALATGTHSAETRQRLLLECIIPKTNQAALRSFLQTTLKQEEDKSAYCNYLNPVLMSMNTSLLDVFVEQKLSLVCPSNTYYGNGPDKPAPSWWELLSEKKDDTGPLLKTLDYLKAHDVNMKFTTSKLSMLSLAMDKANADVIIFALDAGLDPYAVFGDEQARTPAETWVLQRHSFSDLGSYSTPDLQRLQARLRELSAAEANALARKQLYASNLQAVEDGGASLLKYLLQRGASIKQLNQGGTGFIQGGTILTKELQAEIDQLNDQQLQDFICPETRKGGTAYSLYLDARESQNQAFVSYLKQRHMPETCP
ncbi:hypothetical protein ACO0LC_10975 [Undibacterium sp. JH2W]|uniref:hypothetical protein n=1 Tax=Undibacterium sp. JH2W TaxID=3413037 RepID=UPI003BF255D8